MRGPLLPTLVYGLLTLLLPAQALTPSPGFEAVIIARISGHGLTTAEFDGGAGIPVGFALTATFTDTGVFLHGVGMLTIGDMEFDPRVTGGRIAPDLTGVNLTIVEVVDQDGVEGMVLARVPSTVIILPYPRFEVVAAEVQIAQSP